MTKNLVKRFVQTIIFSDGSSIRVPTFLSKHQPRVLLVKTDFNNHPLWKQNKKSQSPTEPRR